MTSRAAFWGIAQMNGVIHDMEIELARGDTMINPKFRTPDGKVMTHDIVMTPSEMTVPAERLDKEFSILPPSG
jgi:hypothetical protein